MRDVSIVEPGTPDQENPKERTEAPGAAASETVEHLALKVLLVWAKVYIRGEVDMHAVNSELL